MREKACRHAAAVVSICAMRAWLAPLLISGLLLAGAGAQPPATRTAAPALTAGAPATATGPMRLRIELAAELAPAGAAGRLLIFMDSGQRRHRGLGTGFIPGSTWVAAREVEHLAAGATIELDPDLLAFPRPFSQAPRGDYRLMVLLDTDHSYGYSGEGPGDLKSEVLELADLEPANGGRIDLRLTQAVPENEPVVETESIKRVELRSGVLSDFWGRAIMLQAGVVLPPGYHDEAQRRFPTVYHFHGFSGDHHDAWSKGPALLRAMQAGEIPAMVHVFLNASFPGGCHQFADSVNAGPWGRALTSELIPHLEERFRCVPKPHARLLTGHSSGGWASLWAQINYPDFFGGTWSTAPDPVDLRSFTGINATPGSTDNAYRDAQGNPRQLVRLGDRWIASIEDFVRQEHVVGEYGGQFASFEWVWSPRGPDGRPLPMFNRQTGQLDQQVLTAWQKFDIRHHLATHWDSLAPKLAGKLHIFCGANDTFRLNEAVILLKEFLDSKHSNATCEIIPERNHSDLYQPHPNYPDGLARRIYQEMASQFEAGENAIRPE